MFFSEGINTSLNIDYILSQTSEENIIKYYFNITKIPCVINSPLRKENKPSFGLYYSKRGIAYTDFKTDENGGLFDLIQKYFNLSHYEALEKINNDLNEIGYCKSNSPKNYYTKNNSNIYERKNSNIKVKIREFNDYDLKFWSDFGISKKYLEFGNIFAISKIFIYKEDSNYILPADKYAYVYVEFKDGVETLKIYQPFSENFKWINNHNNSIWDLWDKLPNKCEEIIIASSRKDALCIWENLEIPSTSLQGEGYIPKESVINQLKEKCNILYCFYDNDFDKEINYGLEASNNMCEMFNLKQLIIPDIYQTKDPSDLYKKYGKEEFIKIINNLKKNGNN